MKWFGLVVLCGCGGASWPGHYGGALESSDHCGDGSGGTQSLPYAVTATEGGGSVLLDIGAPCGVLTAAESGNQAQVSPTMCSNGTRITGGSLRIEGDSLTVGLTSSFTNANGSSCGGSLIGTLGRQKP